MSNKYPIFDDQMTFNITAIDKNCGYNLINQKLDKQASLKRLYISAMNYTVTLEESTVSVPAPQLPDGVAKQLNALCAFSKRPYYYFQNASLLSQKIEIANVTTSPVVIEYIYHSGVCATVSGGEKFLTTFGNDTIRADMNCVSPDTFMLTPNIKQKQIAITLFEIYPDPSLLLEKADPNDPNKPLMDKIKIEYNISRSQAEITDLVSDKQPVYLDYPPVINSTDINGITTFQPVPIVYTINASQPLVISPFVKPISISVIRSGLDGDSKVDFLWYIPILGAIAHPLANFYPSNT